MSFFDIPVILAEAFTVLIVMMTFFYIFNELGGTELDTRTVLEDGKTLMRTANILVIGLVVIVFGASAYLAYQLRFSPIFLPFVIFMIPALLVFAVALANTSAEFAATSAMSGIASEFTTALTTIQYLPQITLGMVAILAIVSLRGGGLA